MALDEIYKEVILDHYKSPRNKRELPGATVHVQPEQPAVRRRDPRLAPSWTATI